MISDSFFQYYIERGRDPYPRGYLRLYPDQKRLLANSRKDLESALFISKDLFINIFSEFQRRERDYDMVVLDIDDESIENAFFKLQYILEKLNGLKYRVVFSGSKGFHVYIPFENTRLNNYRHAVMKWLESIKVLKYVDNKILEPNRVIRVPDTVNTKSKMNCYVIGDEQNVKDLDLDTIVFAAKNGYASHFYTFDYNVGLGMKIATFDNTALPEGKTLVHSTDTVFKDFKFYPPCMQRLVSLAKDNVDINHNERTELAKFLILNGHKDEEIKEYYTGLSDYKEGVTLYQIAYLRDRGLRMSGCDKMTDMGICCKDHSQCPFYPSINKFINLK